MTVKLYTFSKKDNSTARPSGGTSYTCVLKDSSGVLNPSLEFGAGIGNPASYNYAYISAYSRYYYITEWIYYRGVWTASLEVDALASWKDDIGAAELYILRASAGGAWNPQVVDGMYPTIEPCKRLAEIYDTPWGDVYYTTVVGIIGRPDAGGQPGQGSVNYYALNDAQVAALCSWLLALPETGGGYLKELEDTFSYVLDEGLKAQFNPMQYISSIKLFPFNVSMGYVSQSGISIGKLWSPHPANSIRRLYPMAIQVLGPYSVPIPQHPQAATRGMYLMALPYSQYVLEFQPFGRIEIDGSKLITAKGLRCTVYVDLTTGQAQLEVEAVQQDDTVLYIGSYNSEIGVNIQLAQITTDYLGAMWSGLKTGLESPAWNIPIVGPILAGAVGAIDTASKIKWELSSAGAAGSNLPYALKNPMLTLYYHDVADADVDHQGRPACKIARISTYPGYLVCAEGDIPTAATPDEKETIKTALTSGFYYE